MTHQHNIIMEPFLPTQGKNQLQMKTILLIV